MSDMCVFHHQSARLWLRLPFQTMLVGWESGQEIMDLPLRLLVGQDGPEPSARSGQLLSLLPDSARSTSEAAALERELLDEYRFGRLQLVELCGHASAVAVTKAFPLPSLSRKQRTVLVVCGPEQNGAVGLACARHLRVFEYQPSIFCPVRSADALHRDLTTQCEKMDIPFLSFLPAEVSCTHSDPATAHLPSRPLTPPHSPQVRLIDDAYGLVVDAVLGPGVRPAEAGGPCARALATLKRLSIPLVSLDVPSGWDAEAGGDAQDAVQPDVLVSFAAPKSCAGRFSGRHHFVAGRFVPEDVRRKFGLRLPEYTGTDCVAAL
ncbi:yjeF N-terminal domain-containing protein 3 isoform X2 [Peromyscus maniculatus bairdii]|uniref:yjeF N-terminal domain-containing protein 3 isoform X2 n=1 Tax=Peromyscus maniculatus bairdii TaxID=230844 RepID=UPI003FD3467C